MDREAFSRQVTERMLHRRTETSLNETETALLSACVKSALKFSPTQLDRADWHVDVAVEQVPDRRDERLGLYTTVPTLVELGGTALYEFFDGTEDKALAFAAAFASECCTYGLVELLVELGVVMGEEGDQAHLWEQFGLTPVLAEYCSSLAREWEDSVWSLIDAAERLSRE